MATIADAFNPEDRVEVKYSDFYKLIENACSQAAALMYIKNAVMANVPNCYIQSMLDGQKHWEDDIDISNLRYIGPMYGKLNETEENDGNS